MEVLRKLTGTVADATSIAVASVGGVAATNVQAALAELDAEKQPLDALLSSIAGLATDGLIESTSSGAAAAIQAISTLGRALISAADAAAARTSLGAAADAAVIHNTGDETVAGNKTFTGRAAFGTNMALSGGTGFGNAITLGASAYLGVGDNINLQGVQIGLGTNITGNTGAFIAVGLGDFVTLAGNYVVGIGTRMRVSGARSVAVGSGNSSVQGDLHVTRINAFAVGGGNAWPAIFNDSTRLTIDSTRMVVGSSASVDGTERVVNGTFDTDLSGWTVGTGWSWVSGTAKHTSGTATLEQLVNNLIPGAVYVLKFKITGWTVGTVTPTVVGTTDHFGNGQTQNVVEMREVFVAAAASMTVRFTPTSTFDGALDNISVQKSNAGGISLAGQAYLNGDVVLNPGARTLVKTLAANANAGIATLAAGTVTVANTRITGNTMIFYSAQEGASTGVVSLTARTSGVSFTLTSTDAADTRNVVWFIWESF